MVLNLVQIVKLLLLG